jgi:broad specificity phosphatase PhoE
MTLMLVHLVRHGEVRNPDGLIYGDLPGFVLTEEGRAQAQRAAARLAAYPVTTIWSSPLQRALETAVIIAVSRQLPVKVDPDLIEWRLSAWTGIPWADLTDRRPGELETYLANPTGVDFGAESLEALAARVAGVIVRVVQDGAGDVAVVAHQDPLQAARLHLLGQPLSNLHVDKPVHASVITLEPGDPWREVAHWKPSS